MGEHVALASASAHEPKHITDSVIGDSGKIITANSSVAGTSEFRAIVEGDVSSITDLYTISLDNISNASSAWIVIKNTGTVESIRSVIDTTITGADANITSAIAGIAITNGGLTIEFTGSLPGDIDLATPTALNTITGGTALQITTDGGSTTTCKAVFTIEVKRT